MNSILIFNHIPKTGGTTVKTVLTKQYSKKNIFFLETPRKLKQELNDLLTLLRRLDHDIRVIVTHVGSSLESVLPTSYQYKNFTMLRDPIKRVLAYYAHSVKAKGYEPLKSFLENNLGSADKPHSTYNTQTLFLSGEMLEHRLKDRSVTAESCSDCTLESAKAHLLNRGFVVGLTERFDESILLYTKKFKWKPYRNLYIRENTHSNARLFEKELNEENLELIKKYNFYDMQLYAFAKSLYLSQIRENGVTLDKPDYARLFLNSLYAPVCRTRRGIQKIIRLSQGRSE